MLVLGRSLARTWPGAAALGVLALAGLAALAALWWRAGPDAPPARSTPPALEVRERPLAIVPRAPDPMLLSGPDLVRVLEGLEPYWETRNCGDLLHALRLWGPDAIFPATTPLAVSPRAAPAHSRDMLAIFLTEDAFRRQFPTEEPYFTLTPLGPTAREGTSAPAANLHHDDFLALAAELGLGRGTSLAWGGRTFPLEDLVRHSAAWFHPRQEPEFTTVALACYLPPVRSWHDRFGGRHDFDELADLLVRHPLIDGACCATHVPYALAVLLQADDQEGILAPEVRGRVEGRLREISQALARTQTAAGAWDRRWIESRRNAPAAEPELDDWVRNTGHHLEWMALVDPALRPPPEVVRRGVDFLRAVLTRAEPRMLAPAKRYGPYSHAGRALQLLAGRPSAAEVMADAWSRRRAAP